MPARIIKHSNNTLTAYNISGFFERFINYIDVKPKSAETYAKAIKQFCYFMTLNGIERPTRQNIIDFREYLNERHKPATVQLYLTAVRLFFRWTEQEGIYNNIADRIKGPKQDKTHKKDYLTAQQCRQILEAAADSPRDYALLSLMLTTGIRTAEAARADIADLSEIAGQSVLYIQGKGQDEKGLYCKLSAPVYTAIKDYLQGRGILSPEQPLFISDSHRATENGRLTTRSISRIIKKYMLICGLNSDRLTAHSLRHTAAHLNLENGATVEETRELLRHSSITTTYIYINEINREKNNSELRISRAIFEE